MSKNYMIDTNIFFVDPECIEHLKVDNNIYISFSTLEELDNHKSDCGVNGYNVRKAIKNIRKNQEDINFTNNFKDIGFDSAKNDNKIISEAKENNCILISNDIAMGVKSKSIGVVCQEYKYVKVADVGNVRSGKHYIDDEQLLAEFYQKEQLDKFDQMYENDFVLFGEKNNVQEIARVKGDKIIKLKLKNYKPNGIKFKNLDQKLLAHHLTNKELEIITVTGTMGVGKNFISLAVAIDLLECNLYDKIYICKPPIPLNKEFKLGFRPNGFLEKVLPTLTSFTSNLANMSDDKRGVNGVEILNSYIMYNKIEVVDLEYIQGMSLPPRSIIMFDEFQLVEASKEGRALLSRVNEDSLIICTGDLKQMADQRHNIEDSALYHLITTFSGYDKYAHITLDEVVRSGFVAELNNRW